MKKFRVRKKKVFVRSYWQRRGNKLVKISGYVRRNLWLKRKVWRKRKRRK